MDATFYELETQTILLTGIGINLGGLLINDGSINEGETLSPVSLNDFKKNLN